MRNDENEKTFDEPFVCIDHPNHPCVKDVKIGKYICLGCFLEHLK